MTRVMKQLPVPEAYGDPDQDRIWCAWEDCDDPGSRLHTQTVDYGSPGRPVLRRYAFCSETHRGYWERSYYEPVRHGMRPAGVPPRFFTTR